ncbi:SH3 domain-containing protein 19 isoform X1 [Bufo gargarizans]|uniref:SH3 domain-containing protein 19 isoform X1 n=1 Tax=Bufo gargarizans TaxID=30331 RepID=UPI001CF179EA|nr:SH3 domain-containing protein 19 isoform X1 [Bufo gargarizans]
MAEAWLEEEEEELRDSAGNRRHRRSNLTQAAERPERNKPEHRFPGQGPLSSIRAVIKRTSRTTAQSEQQRDRRRPEITIVAAEPIGPGSWFHGGPAGGLGFPPPPPPQWRPSDSHPPEQPPSYEQVIKEISQVQVSTSNSNVEPRRTTTCATQTDFHLEDDYTGPGNNVIHQPVICDQATVQRTTDRSRQSLPFVTNNVQDSALQIAVSNSAGTSTRYEDPNVTRYPVPRPRTKSNLKPVVNNNLSFYQGSSEIFFQGTSEGDLHSSQSSGFDDNFLGDLFEMNNMSHERSQNSILSRIKAFESQAENSENPKRPEVAPRTINTRGAATTKPVLAPKPLSNRVSGEWDPGKDNKPKFTPREGPVPSSLQDTSGATKPDLPKKPKPNLSKSNSNEFPDGVLGTSGSNSKESERKLPVPAPRPLLPKKSIHTDNLVSVSVGAKPLVPGPKFSVASQAKAFNTVETPAARVVQSKSVGDLDLISFDDDVLSPVLPSPDVSDSKANVDPFQLFSKDEAEKEPPAPPTVLRKPTVIRISGKLGKSCEELQTPPPLPTEKPVGSLYNKPSARARPTVRKDWEQFDNAEETCFKPVLPTRPIGIKVMDTPQPQKGPPGRPPPPKISKNASNRDAFPRSTSDVGIGAKHNSSGLNRSKSQVLKRQQPDLPPRPKPGHPLYNKYTLPLPHGIAEKDTVSSNLGELSCKRGEVLVLLEQKDNHYVHCQKGGITGDVKVTNLKIITPLDDSTEIKQKDLPHRMEDSHTPQALVLHDFVGEHVDDLSLTSGEIVYLLEKIDREWYRGKCKGNTGIFPSNHVQILVDLLDKGHPKKNPAASNIKGPRCVARFEFIGDQKDELSFSEGDTVILREYVNEEWAKGELKGHVGIFPINFVEILEDLPNKTTAPDSKKNKASASSAQLNRLSGEWYEALYDFTAETEDDLPFRKGDKILVIERLDSEWYKGRLNGREGILPAAFVQLCSGPTAGQTQGGKPGKARALYDFCGENEDELSFKAGDVITALEPVDDEWMSGELYGKTGIFPKNFVQKC